MNIEISPDSGFAKGRSARFTRRMDDELFPDLITAVEQQMASPQTPYVAAAHARLIALGLDSEEAKSQIAVCLGEEMEKILKTRKPFDEASYRAALDALPLEEEA
ncbi:MAG: hypothetical protein V4640_16255 [Verrucomicrobiota bacterium]